MRRFSTFSRSLAEYCSRLTSKAAFFTTPLRMSPVRILSHFVAKVIWITHVVTSQNGSKLLILPHPHDPLLGLHVQEMQHEIAAAVVGHVAVEPPLGKDLHVIAQVPRPEQVNDRPLLGQPVGQELLLTPYVLKESPRPVALAKEHSSSQMSPFIIRLSASDQVKLKVDRLVRWNKGSRDVRVTVHIRAGLAAKCSPPNEHRCIFFNERAMS